jgi:hypothetical protein
VPDVRLRPSRPGDIGFITALVRDANARARKVYRNLGFERFDPAPGERKIYDAIAEPPGEGACRMRLLRIVLRF